MHCGFAAAGMGYRPENSDKETTSLETPSVPTSDGLKRPVGLPEVGPQTNDPASRRLDCPVSPPPPLPESCSAETVNPRAAKPADSPCELPATLESKALLPPLRGLPEHVAASANARASLAEDAGKTPCIGPKLPPPNQSEKAFVWGSLHSSDDAQHDALDAEPPDGLRGQGTSPNTHSQAEELDIPLLMEHVEEPHMDLPKTRTKTERDQDKPDSGEHLCPMALSPLAAPVELNPEDFFSEGRAGTEWERGISPAEKRRLEEIGCEHRGGGGGISMEVAEEPFVATDSLLSRPGATQPAAGAECSRMEVETSTHPPSLPISSPASDLTQREVTAFESTGVVGLVDPPSSRGQLSDQAEDPCISLTSALKELHQLLIVNSKQDLNVSQQEDLPPSTSVPQEQATGQEVHREEREPAYLDSPALPLLFPGYTGVESSVKRQVFEAEVESTHVMERHRLAESHEQDMLTVQETSAVDTSGFLNLPAFSSQAQAGEHVEEIFSQHPNSNHVLGSEASEQSQPPPFSLLQSPSQSSFSENMETSGALDTDFQRLMNELLDSSPPLPRDCPQLPISNAEDVDQIVRSGFTPQEATEALERAGGNAELALLILLAKNIVVPT